VISGAPHANVPSATVSACARGHCAHDTRNLCYRPTRATKRNIVNVKPKRDVAVQARHPTTLVVVDDDGAP
jgi:hypothetical protein